MIKQLHILVLLMLTFRVIDGRVAVAEKVAAITEIPVGNKAPAVSAQPEQKNLSDSPASQTDAKISEPITVEELPKPVSEEKSLPSQPEESPTSKLQSTSNLETDVVAPKIPSQDESTQELKEPLKEPESKKTSVKKKDFSKLQTPRSMADAPINVTSPTLTQTERHQEAISAAKKLTASGGVNLGQYLDPWKGADPDERVEMNFENKEISELLKFLSEALDITFILDDYIEPVRADGLQPLAGSKINFKSTIPLSLRQAWDIGLTFLEMAGFSIIPATLPRTYRVTTNASKDKASANREPLPTFIGVDPELLPDTDAKIRYVFLADSANTDLGTLIQIIESMKSSSAGPLIEVAPLRAVIMTDKAANIRSTMMIIKEIEKVSSPETLSIIRLKHTDAKDVKDLYYSLIGQDSKSPVFNPFNRQRKAPTTQYFSDTTRVFEEPHTNSLIVLGTRENVKRFEEFVFKYIDTTLDIPFSPLHIIRLKFVDAASIAKILNDVIQRFNSHPSNSSAALVGGVRDGNKFFKPTVRITEESSGNRLIINSDYEEYLKLREIIEKLDVEQPQVAIKMLILNVDLSNTNQIGTQLRNSVGCSDGNGGMQSILGKNVNFQTALIGVPAPTGPIVTNPASDQNVANPVNGAYRLLGNLIRLADTVNGSSAFDAGTTLVTLGKDIFGFWGLLQMLESYTRTTVIANPFFTATHKYKTEFKVGETRRTTTAIVTGQRETQAQGDLSADLKIVLTPQISFDDMVELNVYIELGQFIDPNTQDRIVRKVSTQALVADKEVLALGGFIQDRTVVTIQKVPILGDIPFFGWLFKSERKTIERTSLVILILPEIIKPHVAEAFTFSKINESKEILNSMQSPIRDKDPIHRWFFRDHKEKASRSIDKFVAIQQRYIDEDLKSQQLESLSKTPLPEKATKSKKRKVSSQGLLDLVANPIGAPAA